MTSHSPASPPVREGFVPGPNAQLFFREVVTNRPPLVVLHGGPDFNHNYLLPELDRLSEAFRLIYYDQRGRGKSSRSVAPQNVTIESELDDLDRLRRHFGLDSVALLGHSWGAVLALEYAVSHPGVVSCLMLLNSAPASHVDVLRLQEQRTVAEAARLARMRAIASTAEYLSGDIEVEAEYYRLHFADALCGSTHSLESLVRRLRAHFTPEDIVKARAIENRLYEQTWRLVDYDLTDRLRNLHVPTLVIHGDHDLIPLECASHIAEAVSGSRLIVLGHCGHFCYLECPIETLDAIARFVARR